MKSKKYTSGLVLLLSSMAITCGSLASPHILYADESIDYEIDSFSDDDSVTEESLIETIEPIEPTQDTIPEEPEEADNLTSGGVSATNPTAEKPQIKNGFVKEGSAWLYYTNNAVATGTDIVYGTINAVPGWYYINNGKADLTKVGVEHNIHGWWYVKNGKVDFSYNGFAQNQHGWWYIQNGKVTFTKSEVTYGTVTGVTAWWNVKGSKVIFNESIEPNQHGWWYVNNGKVDFTKTSVEHNQHGWWYVQNGKVNFGYNGFAQNKHGWWYIQNGKVTFTKSEVTYGTVNGVTAWWNVKGSKVTFNDSVEPNQHGWWYIKNGKVDFSYTGAAENIHGIWRIEKGKVNFNYNIATKENGVWVGFVNGKKDASAAVVAHASADENKRFMFGKAGDQTKEEVYCRTWNDHPWPFVIRAKSPAMAEKIAYAMERAVENDNIGYDMSQRNTLYNLASKVGWDPRRVTSPCETDCSALVTVALIYAGVNKNAVYKDNNCSVTGNLRMRLLSTGQFEVLTSESYTKRPDNLKRGDILLEEGEHTAVVVKPVTK